MANNLKENLTLMTLTACIQSRQGWSLARENSVLSLKLTTLHGSQPKALPALDGALIWDGMIYDETADGPDLEIG